MARPMSPAQRDWMVRMADQWADRAAALRASPDRSAAIRAGVIESIVAGFRARIMSPRLADDVEADRLQAILDACPGPRIHPEWRIMVSDHPLLDQVEHRIRCKIASLRGEPEPAMIIKRPIIAAPEPPPAPLPPPEAIPFTAGPQLALFEFAA